MLLVRCCVLYVVRYWLFVARWIDFVFAVCDVCRLLLLVVGCSLFAVRHVTVVFGV